MSSKNKIPISLKIIFTSFIFFLIPIYSYFYGWKNFLWFSNIGLFLTIPALWLESSLIISILAITILPLELLWNIDFFSHLILRTGVVDNLASYMFDPTLPAWLRCLSLYHVALPFIWIYCLYRLRYNSKAFIYALIAIPSIFLTSFFLSTQEDNVNWVNMAGISGWNISQLGWVLILIGASLLVICMPLHLIFRRYLSVQQ